MRSLGLWPFDLNLGADGSQHAQPHGVLHAHCAALFLQVLAVAEVNPSQARDFVGVGGDVGVSGALNDSGKTAHLHQCGFVGSSRCAGNYFLDLFACAKGVFPFGVVHGRDCAY